VQAGEGAAAGGDQREGAAGRSGRPRRRAEAGDDAGVEGVEGVEVEGVPGGRGEVVEVGLLAAVDAGRALAAGQPGVHEGGDGDLGLELHEGVDLGVGAQEVAAGDGDVVLAGLVAVGEEERGGRPAGADVRKDSREQVVAHRRAVERGEGDDDAGDVVLGEVGEEGRGVDAEAGAAIGAPGQAGGRLGVGVDEADAVLAERAQEDGGELDGAEVGDVRIVDEVPGDRDRRMHDRYEVCKSVSL
jgi:hypothetical protein